MSTILGMIALAVLWLGPVVVLVLWDDRRAIAAFLRRWSLLGIPAVLLAIHAVAVIGA